MGKKHKRGKVKLPCDSTGAPINVGDLLEWCDGQRLKVASMSYYGEGANGTVRWTADDEDGNFSDNLKASTIVRRG